MKILLMGLTKIKFMPYLNFYLEQLSAHNEIHILAWNRDCRGDIRPPGAYVHELRRVQKDEVGKLFKIKGFLEYRRFAKKLIRQERFDFIIVLHSLTGVVIRGLLKKRYRNRYILDYRDFTYENNRIFKSVIRGLVNNSRAAFVSSGAYRRYLPQSPELFASHNLLTDSLNHRENRRSLKRDTCPIRISFWGFIRHENINREIIKRLANDPRFELHYYGTEQKTASDLKEYCRANKCANVYFHGEYAPRQRYEFAKTTDLIHNIYDNADRTAQLAVGNKYYDGIIFFIPQLCREGSYMADLVSDSGLGLPCNPYLDNFADAVFEYYTSIEWQDFENNCERVLQKVLSEYNQGKKVLESIGA